MLGVGANDYSHLYNIKFTFEVLDQTAEYGWCYVGLAQIIVKYQTLNGVQTFGKIFFSNW